MCVATSDGGLSPAEFRKFFGIVLGAAAKHLEGEIVALQERLAAERAAAQEKLAASRAATLASAAASASSALPMLRRASDRFECNAEVSVAAVHVIASRYAAAAP